MASEAQMKVRELVQEIRRAGCVPVSKRGSHQKWRTPQGQMVILKVNHLDDDVSHVVLNNTRKTLKKEGLDV